MVWVGVKVGVAVFVGVLVGEPVGGGVGTIVQHPSKVLNPPVGTSKAHISNVEKKPICIFLTIPSQPV
jgi:hypothetical protein